MTPRLTRSVRAAAPALVVALLLASCTKDTGAGVTVDKVGRSTVTEVVEAPANVVARATATVSSPADGTVASVAVADGAPVRAGQVLVRIDSPSARAALAQAEAADRNAASSGAVSVPSVSTSGLARADQQAAAAFAAARRAAAQIPDPGVRAQTLAQVASAEAQYAAARSQAQRAVGQVNAGLGSIERAAASLAQARRAQTRAALSAARERVKALVVRAPISGTVILGGGGGGGGNGGAGGGGSDLSSLVSQLPSSVQGQAQSLLGGGGGSGASVVGAVEAGTPVSSGAALLTVTDVSTLTLAASVDETDVLLVKPGVSADVELDAVPGASYAATVTSVDLAPTTSSRGGVSYVVRLRLDGGTGANGDPAPAPLPGMSAVASLKVLTASDVVTVPSSAVFRDGSRDAVWRVVDGRAERRQVELGAQGEASVQVLSGLVVGDRVVVSGADRVTAGQRVEGQ